MFWQSEIKARTRTWSPRCRVRRQPETERRECEEVKSEGDSFVRKIFLPRMELQEYITGQVTDSSNSSSSSRSKFCGIAKRTIRLSFMLATSLYCVPRKWSPKDPLFYPFYLHNKLVAYTPGHKAHICLIFWSITMFFLGHFSETSAHN